MQLPCAPISSQVCSFACASFCIDVGTTAPFVPLGTAGEATSAAGGGGGTAPGARGVLGIELPFRCSGCPWACGGGGSEWECVWETWGS